MATAKVKTKVIEYRAHQWIDTKTNKTLYGIQARLEGGPWMHTIAGNPPKPVLFRRESVRDNVLRAMKLETK